MTRLTSLPSKGRTLCWRGSPGNVVGPRRGGAVFLIWGTCSCFVPLLVGVNTVVFSVIEHVTGGADAKSATHFVLALCITTSRSTVSHPDTLNLNIYMLTRSPSPAPGSRPTWPRAPLIEGMLALSPQKNAATAQGTQFLHSHARGAYMLRSIHRRLRRSPTPHADPRCTSVGREQRWASRQSQDSGTCPPSQARSSCPASCGLQVLPGQPHRARTGSRRQKKMQVRTLLAVVSTRAWWVRTHKTYRSARCGRCPTSYPSPRS
jgi:hypothetical protein